MNKTRKIMALCLAIAIMAALGLTAYAASEEKPAYNKKGSIHVNVITIAASVLEKNEDEVKESVKSGKIGDLLISANKVDDFKAAYLAETKAKLDTAVTNSKLTQTQADEKYTAAEVKMAAYDGTTHLCGSNDHSKMFEKKSKSRDASGTKKPRGKS